jgi:hypothetical protein
VEFVAEERAPAPRTVQLDVEALYRAVDRRRRELGVSKREVCRQVGEHTPSAVTRLGRGVRPSTDQLVRLLHWLGETDLAPYIAPVEAKAASQDA